MHRARLGALAMLMLVICPDFGAEPNLALPQRPATAPTGSEFAREVESLPLEQREEKLRAQVLSGNVPQFLRKLCPVPIQTVAAGQTNTGVFYATPDYLGIGSDQDYLLMPISPNLAQSLADALHCSLPTRKMVDAIYAAAEVKLTPSPIPPSASMTTVAVFKTHNDRVKEQRTLELPAHPMGALTAGHKKDLVISVRLSANPGKVAIYGWHQTNGVPIQPLYLGHTSAWVDYSQCTRLVAQELMVNGRATTISEVLKQPALAAILSDEGILVEPRYPTNRIKASPTTSATQPPGTNTSRGFAGFQDSRWFGERVSTFELNPGIRIHINAPPQAALRGKNPLQLIVYALPNGNTIEQTVGKALQPGDDWHYGIQHIAAQTRFLRKVLTNTPIVVAYFENNLKSWPAWRKANGDKGIPAAIEYVQKLFADYRVETLLSGHSGGGSLVFGYLNTVEKIPNNVTRLAFLDSNYAYDQKAGHLDKITDWLKSETPHYFCVLAYNDVVALLNGKTFVSAAGGTWGKSHEMQRDFAEQFAFNSQTDAEFERYFALNRRVQFLLKTNPKKEILHTVQVERNGFIHSILSGTTCESQGYTYFGPRAYQDYIQTE